jgi:uncharacterized protein (TIGR03086 family)
MAQNKATLDKETRCPSKAIRERSSRSFDQTASLIAAVTPEQLDLPTPCTEFDVRTLVGHIVFAARRLAKAAGNGPVPEDGPAVTGVDDADWPGVFGEAAAEALAAWAADEKLGEEVELPFGKFPGSVVVQIYAQEQITHGWDLAVATQQRDVLDESLAEATLPMMVEMIPADFRGGEMPFEAVVEVPEDAPAYDRLAGYLGRKPL